MNASKRFGQLVELVGALAGAIKKNHDETIDVALGQIAALAISWLEDRADLRDADDPARGLIAIAAPKVD